MNKYQNNVGKFVPPPTFLTSQTKTQGNNQNQEPTRNQQKPLKTKNSGALNIFYESKTFKTESPHCEWNFRNARTKKPRIITLKSERKRNKIKNNESNLKNNPNGEVGRKDPFTFDFGTNYNQQELQTKKENTKEENALKTDLLKLRERETSNNVFIFTKGEKKPEINVKPKGPFFVVNPGVTLKPSEKIQSKASEIKTTPSVFGKKNINEILKNHAQKMQKSSEKILILKDFKTDEEVSGHGTTTKTVEENSEGVNTTNDEKKKTSITFLKQHPSKELKKQSKPLILSTHEEKTHEDKSEKRVTHTDQLLTSKTTTKNSEDQKPATEKTSSEPKKEKGKKHTEMVLKKPVTAHLYKDLIVKSGVGKHDPYLDLDPEFKSNARVTELRELVAAAIREHKIFCIFDNHTYIVRPVREELLNRGWMEIIADRRLIPRRRPPPMGPTSDRDKAFVGQNCNTLEAVLAARELFVEELQENVSKASFKLFVEKPKILTTRLAIKKSDESLTETLSRFRITPPGTEKRKNNFEIREFVVKYQIYVNKEKEREIELKKFREKEKNFKNSKKEKSKPQEQKKVKEQELKATDSPSVLGMDSEDLKAIKDTITGNRKVILHAKTEIKTLTGEELILKEPLPMLTNEAEAKSQPEEKTVENKTKTQGSGGNPHFNDVETRMISKLIQASNARIHFMWLSIKPGIHLKCFNYSPEIINKFQRTTFCTKIGLWSHLSNMQWYAHEVAHPAKSPRMYNTGEADDLQAFFHDFQITACIGMLKWLCDTLLEKGLKAIQKKKGKVPIKAFEFAIKQCEVYIRHRENEDLNSGEESKVHDEEWNTFLQYFYIITNDNGRVQECSSAQIMVVHSRAVETLKVMKRYWPEMDIDGRLNIWIMKPYCASCGRGIFMTNNVYYISQHSKYIVQKYIEKPLLIYNTKFDIRQWFMITKLTPLEIWMYKECYLRFCSQPFALRNLHESVHLSNNSVQRKYIDYKDPQLPNQNMWDSNTFQLYLKTIGFPTAWEEIIYPGMKDAIVSTMLASQDTFDGPRKSWFEVYGADFMLSSNVKDGPWLIEINENPAMDPSTSVTARLCPQMLRDVIKVVVDKRANKNASTGQWELIYRQNYSPSFGTVDLDVRGKKIAKVPFLTRLSPPSANGYFKGPKRGETNESKNHLYEFVKSYKPVPKGGSS